MLMISPVDSKMEDDRQDIKKFGAIGIDAHWALEQASLSATLSFQYHEDVL